MRKRSAVGMTSRTSSRSSAVAPCPVSSPFTALTSGGTNDVMSARTTPLLSFEGVTNVLLTDDVEAHALE
jgi:hypothetical protein